MIQMITPVYTTKDMKYTVADVKQAIRLSRKMCHVYLIALNRRSGGHVEIFRLNELVKQFAPERDLVIAGIAESYGRARELLVEILEEAIARTGSADTAAYLSEHEGKELVSVRE